MAIQNNLKKCRLAAGKTQKDVSEAVQTTVNTISRYERGSSCPSLETALRLSDYFKKPMNELFQLV